MAGRISAPGMLSSSAEGGGRGEISAAAAHEIKNVVDAIANVLHLLKAEVHGKSGAHYVEMIEEELGHIAQMARDELEPLHEAASLQAIRLDSVTAGILELYASRLTPSTSA